ncbi:hypothetical protein B0H19DRAFT_1245833 [Mycena capillaripes]|nr:hypothetical protein B0H19DRAFT_1245833 [Mycena capillaripes]
MPTTTARSLARKIDVKYDSKTFARFTYRKSCNLQLLKALEMSAEILYLGGRVVFAPRTSYL